MFSVDTNDKNTRPFPAGTLFSISLSGFTSALTDYLCLTSNNIRWPDYNRIALKSPAADYHIK